MEMKLRKQMRVKIRSGNATSFTIETSCALPLISLASPAYVLRSLNSQSSEALQSHLEHHASYRECNITA